MDERTSAAVQLLGAATAQYNFYNNANLRALRLVSSAPGAPI
jgi:hypothetical protein